MNTVEILKRARALIADEKNWTQGVYARNAHGSDVTYESAHAVCFCSTGALFRASPPDGVADAYDVLRRACIEMGEENPTRFNDRHNHSEVIALFDRAMTSAESEAA